MGCAKSRQENVSKTSIVAHAITRTFTDEHHWTNEKCKVSLHKPMWYNPNVQCSKMGFESYVQNRIDKKIKRKNKSDKTKCDIPSMLENGKCIIADMKKSYMVPSYIFNNVTYLCITAGFVNKLQKILFVSGKLNERHNLQIINLETNEHLLIWWHSGEFNDYFFQQFLEKIVGEQIKNNFNLKPISAGTYIIKIDPTILFDTVWKFKKTIIA